MKRIAVVITFFMTGILATSNVFGQQGSKPAEAGKQEPAKSEEKSEASKEAKVTGSYLDITHAKDNAIEYEEIIKDHIYKLQVVVANFGEASDKTALDSIVKEHIQGKKELFKRKYLSAANILKKVRNDIRSLYTTIANRYQTKANDILGLCAETLVDREIGLGTKQSSDVENAARASKKITQNRIKLIIAYDQLNMGDKFKFEERLADAVTHYRLAKTHGINILVDLAESEADKNNLKSQYKVDMMDGENLISR